MPLKTNAPSEPVRWTLQRGAREFSISPASLGSRLNDSQQYAGEDECFGTAQITAAIYGAAYEQRTKKLKAEAAKTELEIEILRGAWLPKAELMRVMSEIANAMLMVIKASKLSRGEQDDLRRMLSRIPVRLADMGKVENRSGVNGQNGNGARPANRRKYELASEEAATPKPKKKRQS